MVRVSNLPALKLYRKLNYDIVDTWRRYYEDGEDAYVMEKALTPSPLSRNKKHISGEGEHDAPSPA